VLCTATTKAGEPCSRNAVSGSELCIAHAPDEVKRSQGFGGAQPGAGRPPRPRVVDVIRERIEADLDLVLKPLVEALEAGKADGPDYAIRIQAARELLDRSYGKPRQGTDVEVSGSLSLNVLDLAAMLDDDASEDAA
jgi:hypothetical protein